MKRGLVRRGVAAAAVGVAVLVGSASPAFAHFCRKTDFNSTAAAKAGGSEAWLTADEWREFLPFIAAECPAAVPLIEDILDAGEASGTTLFMGPGLLAGGTLQNGNTPEHFAYMLEAFSVCEF